MSKTRTTRSKHTTRTKQISTKHKSKANVTDNVNANNKTKSKTKSKTKNQLVRKFTIGDWGHEREPKIVIFSQNMDNPDKIDLILYEKHTLDYVNKFTDRFNFNKELSIGKWNHKKYTIDKENSIYIWTNSSKMNDKSYYDSYMDDGLKDFDEIYYAVIRLNKTRYLSLGFILSEFDMPDNDTIVNIDASRSKGGNQNIKLIGVKNSYFIDDGTCTPYLNLGCDCYVSHENNKKYKLDYFFCDEGYIDGKEVDSPKLYIETYKAIPSKFLGIKYNKYKKEKVYNVIHSLKTEPIIWDATSSTKK